MVVHLLQLPSFPRWHVWFVAVVVAVRALASASKTGLKGNKHRRLACKAISRGARGLGGDCRGC